MIQMGTILEVADNSGARRIACIKMRGGAAGRYARLGDIITASVKEAAPDSPFVEKHGKRVVRAVIVRTRRNHRRRDGRRRFGLRRLASIKPEEDHRSSRRCEGIYDQMPNPLGHALMGTLVRHRSPPI